MIYTDEPGLMVHRLRSVITEHVFPATRLVTKACLLMSYDPWEKRYPCIQLNIARRARP